MVCFGSYREEGGWRFVGLGADGLGDVGHQKYPQICRYGCKFTHVTHVLVCVCDGINKYFTERYRLLYPFFNDDTSNCFYLCHFLFFW